MNELRYTIVNHEARKKFGLTITEYFVADSIYNLSNNPSTGGYAIASKKYLAEFLGISERSVFDAIKVCVEKGIVEKPEKANYHDNRLRTTQLWYDAAIMKNLHNHHENISELECQEQPIDYEKSAYNKDKARLGYKEVYNDNGVVVVSFDNYGEFKIERKQLKLEYSDEDHRRAKELIESKNDIENPAGFYVDAVNKGWTINEAPPPLNNYPHPKSVEQTRVEQLKKLEEESLIKKQSTGDIDNGINGMKRAIGL